MTGTVSAQIEVKVAKTFMVIGGDVPLKTLVNSFYDSFTPRGSAVRIRDRPPETPTQFRSAHCRWHSNGTECILAPLAFPFRSTHYVRAARSSSFCESSLNPSLNPSLNQSESSTA